MSVRPQLRGWFREVQGEMYAFSLALGPPVDRERIVLSGRLALHALGRAAPGPAGEEQAIARLYVAVAELVVAARDGDDEALRFALRWVTESISALGA